MLHPSFYKPGTATGEALRAHELYHVWQRAVYPDFDRLFSKYAEETEQAGLDPWENPYEKPAYAFEEKVKEYLLSQGLTD